MAATKCSGCGLKIEPNWEFCPKCSRSLQTGAEEAAEENTSAAQASAPTEQVRCPKCGEDRVIASNQTWLQCTSCGRFVRAMRCPATGKTTHVHSPGRRKLPYKCPSCGKLTRHTAPALTEANQFAPQAESRKDATLTIFVSQSTTGTVECPSCGAHRPLDSGDQTRLWYRCEVCSSYVRLALCPKDKRKKPFLVASTEPGAFSFECPRCGRSHEALSTTEMEAAQQGDEARTGVPKQTASELLSKLHPNAREGIEKNLQSGEEVLEVVTSDKRQSLTATNRRLFIFKKGAATGGFFNEQLNSWDYSNISGIEVKKSMSIQAVVVLVPGAAPVTEVKRLSNGPNSGWEAPNAVMVERGDVTEQIARIRTLIADHQRELSGHRDPAPSDPIDQVKRLAELRDEGLLTPAEFERKKRELLGL